MTLSNLPESQVDAGEKVAEVLAEAVVPVAVPVVVDGKREVVVDEVFSVEGSRNVVEVEVVVLETDHLADR